jgi:Xaa-Pro aminopeptidase
MQMMDTGVAVLPAASVSVRNRDVEFPYRQDSDFVYLTGFPEPEAVLVLIPDREEGEFVLFCRERSPEMETWNGRRAGLEGARSDYGADEAFPITELDERMPELLQDRERVYYTLGKRADFDQRFMVWLNRVRGKARTGVRAPRVFVSLDDLVHGLRLIKSPAEIKAMRRAAEISAAAHRRAMEVCQPGMLESQLEAELIHEFMRQGCRSPAYPSIVGSGRNACILHYTQNTARLRHGDLVLIDAGGEYEHYAADITRTFPVSGRFSAAQKAVYEVVLSAQKAAIAKVRTGSRWNEPHDAAVRVLTEGMVELGLLQGAVDELITQEAYRRFYMHRTGHWLGMDVHDVGDYKVDGEWRVLEPGMVLTVEPGIYIPESEGEEAVAQHWRNIGIRIEDDVLVTRAGHEILSASVPKAIDDIEALVGAGGVPSADKVRRLKAHG